MSAVVDYEVEYNNRARVPENPALMTGWARDAKAYREAHQGPIDEVTATEHAVCLVPDVSVTMPKPCRHVDRMSKVGRTMVVRT